MATYLPNGQAENLNTTQYGDESRAVTSDDQIGLDDEVTTMPVGELSQSPTYEAVQTDYDPDVHGVEARVQRIIDKNSAPLRMARTRARQEGNARGLLNTSMTVQAGEAAAYQYAMPIAEADTRFELQNKQFNTDATNTARRFNTEGAMRLNELREQGVIESRQIQERGDIESRLQAEKADIDERLLRAGGQEDRETLRLRNQNEIELQILRNDADFNLQELRGDQQAAITAMQSEYQTLLEANRSAALLYREMASDINETLANGDLTPEAKQAIIDNIVAQRNLGLRLIGGISNLNLEDFIQGIDTTPDASDTGGGDTEQPDFGGGTGDDTGGDAGDGTGGDTGGDAGGGAVDGTTQIQFGDVMGGDYSAFGGEEGFYASVASALEGMGLDPTQASALSRAAPEAIRILTDMYNMRQQSINGLANELMGSRIFADIREAALGTSNAGGDTGGGTGNTGGGHENPDATGGTGTDTGGGQAPPVAVQRATAAADQFRREGIDTPEFGNIITRLEAGEISVDDAMKWMTKAAESAQFQSSGLSQDRDGDGFIGDPNKGLTAEAVERARPVASLMQTFEQEGISNPQFRRILDSVVAGERTPQDAIKWMNRVAEAELYNRTGQKGDRDGDGYIGDPRRGILASNR